MYDKRDTCAIGLDVQDDSDQRSGILKSCSEGSAFPDCLLLHGPMLLKQIHTDAAEQ